MPLLKIPVIPDSAHFKRHGPGSLLPADSMMFDIEKDENTFYDKSERNSYTYIKMLIENFYEDNAKTMKTSNSPDIKKENLIYLIKKILLFIIKKIFILLDYHLF